MIGMPGHYFLSNTRTYHHRLWAGAIQPHDILMAVRVKSFRITSEADETEMNRFLEGKMIRQWSADHEDGAWQVLIAYDNAREERPQERTNDRNKKNDRTSDRGERNQRNGNDRNDRSNGAPHMEQRPPKEKREREPQVIDVPESDLPLYEAVRKWRNARAREADVKPFQLFNNKQLESLVKAKPASSDELRAILTDMDPGMYDRYQHELLGFIQGATNGTTFSTEPATL
jgi:superfamily II DNA helicase RecQ